jgi:hypothetical protein
VEALAADFVSIFWPVLYLAQIRFVVGSDRRYQLFLGGRGTGKTWALMLKALFLALLNPNCPGAVFGRTVKEIEHKLRPMFFQHVETFRRATGINLVVHHNKGDQTTTLITGGLIYWLSYGREDALANDRGYDLAWAVMDEIEHSQVNAAYAFGVVNFAIRHPLARVQQLAVATTPDGLRGVTADFVKAQRNNSPDHYVCRSTVYDNPYTSEDEKAKLKASCSKRLWKQEGLGVVLMPSGVVFAEYDETAHLIPWKWDPRLPYVMGIDWGTSNAYWMQAQVLPDEMRIGDRVLPAGSWVVARERKVEDVSRAQWRRMVEEAVDEAGGPPACMVGDRAVKKENGWLRGAFAAMTEYGIKTCDSRDEQSVIHGVEAVRSMLDPADGTAPRLYLSQELDPTLSIDGRGLRGALINYRYVRRRTDDGDLVTTNKPNKDDINDHQVDGLRMAVIKTAKVAELHGGDVLPFLQRHSNMDLDQRRRRAA